MRNLILIATVALILAFCQPGPTASELASKYKSNPDAFEHLSRMIKEDTRNNDYFVVGLDHIGDYWEYLGKWTKDHDYKTKLLLPDVLKAVGLTQNRYDEYKQLFSSTGSERISFYVPQNLVTVLVYRSGLVGSGCYGTINWSNTHHSTSVKHEITELGNGWYLEYECT